MNESQPTRLDVLRWRVRWCYAARRQRLLLWIVWHLPKPVIFWAFYRVIGAYGDGQVFDWPVKRVADDLEAWNR